MKFVRDIETALGHALMPYWLYAMGVLAVLTAPSRLTDFTHEIQLIGSAWFRGGSIPLVQAYSNFGPINLYLGSIYDRFITNGFTSRVFELLCFTLVAGLLYLWLKQLHPKKTAYQNSLLAFGVLIISIPGVWQVGINPVKLSLIFLLSLYLCFDLWQKSGKSYWFFGETERNWRYLLLSGILLGLLVYTSLLFTLFAIPVFASYVRFARKDWRSALSNSPLILVPVLGLSWVWYSYFASRKLLGEAFRASALDFRLATHTSFGFMEHATIIFPMLLLALFVVLSVRRDNFVKDRRTWIIGLGILEGLAVSRGGILQTLPFIFLLAVPLYFNKLRLGYVALWCGVGLLLVLPYRYMDTARSNLVAAQARFAETYVTQRLVDTKYVLYYGRGAGFFADSELVGSTRFYNSAIFTLDNPRLALVDKFRGDNEANTPLFVVYATDKDTRAGDVPRIQEYFTKHYDEVGKLPGYTILKRK